MPAEKNHFLYEKLSKIYEIFFKPFFISGIRKTIRVILEKNPKSLLEVGVGTGYSLGYYSDEVEVQAVDISSKMVEISKKRAEDLGCKNIKVFESKDLTGEQFPAVVSFSVITVVPDPQVFLNELKSYTLSGGFIYLAMHRRGKGLLYLLDLLMEWPCRLLFGFSLLRDLKDLDLSGLELIEEKTLNRFLFYPYNHLFVLKKL